MPVLVVAGADGCIYGIPCNARRVSRQIKFNPVEELLTEIGPDLGGSGVLVCWLTMDVFTAFLLPPIAF